MRQLGTCLVAAAVVAGCTPSDTAPVRLGGEAPPRVVATFSGEADVLAGTLTITALDAPVGQALTELPVVRDGVPGVGPDDTVELVTEGTATISGGCGAVDAFEGRIRLRSFYASASLRNAYAEILQLVPSGREACNSAPAVPGVSSALGLFSYGTLARKGLAGSSAVAAWRFRLPDATQFTFRGRIMADVVPGCATPGLPGVPAVVLPNVPAGVAVADLAGDALPDLAAVAGAGGAAVLEIAAGTGGGRFTRQPPTALGATFASPVQTAVANVRGSAAPDVLYTDASGTLVVHENLGGGAWGAATAYAAAGAGAVATSDLDGDGDLDVAVAGTGLTAFLNAGGAFTAVAATGAASSGRAILVGDLDGDGRRDVVTVSGPSLVLAPQTTRGAFGFRTAVAAAVPLAGADLWDVALLRSGTTRYAYAANHGSSCLARFRTNAPGKAFVYETCAALPFAPERVAAADLDGNGTDDLAVAGAGVVQVLLADAAQPGGFRAATYGGVPSPSRVAISDLNGDGAADLVVTSPAARGHAVLLNAGAGTFRAPLRVQAGAGADGLVAVSLGGDALLDLAVASRGAATVTPLLGAGGGAFVAGTAVALPAPPVAIAAGDVNRDGRADVAVALAATGQICVLAGNGAGGLGAPACAAVGAAPAGVALLDLTGDGALDAAVTLDDAAGSVLVLRNDGAGSLARDAGLDGAATPHAVGVVAADLTGDGRADLAIAGDALAVLPGTGAGLGTPRLASHDGGARALAVGDLDGDGALDAVTTGPDELQLFLSDGAGGLAFAAAFPFPSPAGVAIEDLNGDGALDVAATSSSLGAVGVLWNRGTGSFDPALDALVRWPAAAAGAGLVAADLDGDVRPDLAAADSAGAVDVLRAVCLP